MLDTICIVCGVEAQVFAVDVGYEADPFSRKIIQIRVEETLLNHHGD